MPCGKGFAPCLRVTKGDKRVTSCASLKKKPTLALTVMSIGRKSCSDG